MIVHPSDFQAEITIGQSNYGDVRAVIEEFINKYEPLYLSDLLGEKLAKELEDAIEDNPEQKWIDLADKVRLPCADYIYFWYQRSDASQTGGVGETVPYADNAKKVSSINKSVRAWNEMVILSKKIVCNMDTSVYPNFQPCCNSDIFSPINTFGI